MAERAELDHFVTMAIAARGYSAELDLDLAISIFSDLAGTNRLASTNRRGSTWQRCSAMATTMAQRSTRQDGRARGASKRCCYIVTHAYIASPPPRSRRGKSADGQICRGPFGGAGSGRRLMPI